MKEIDKMDKLDEKQIKENLKKYGAEKLLAIFKKPESYFAKYESYKEIEDLKKCCKDCGITINFQPSLARGLSYYNGTVVEVKSAEMKETIIAGGAYSINNLQSFGVSFGLERMTSLAKIELPSKSALVISIGKDKEAVGMSEKLRSEGICCAVMFGKISKALEYANSNTIPYVIFFGEEEAKKKKVKLRNMKSGKEEMVSIKDISKKLK
jgi:histidyl-tRNA synthetase